jgi:hypothetical protein
VRAIRSATDVVRARRGIAAIVSLGFAWAVVMHASGWNQNAHFAQVRALAHGQAQIDRWQWETGDKAWINHHFYSVKAPGVAALSLPAYLAIDALDGRDVARTMAANEQNTAHPAWRPDPDPPYEDYGFSAKRAHRVDERIAEETPIIWALTLIAAVIPAVLLLLGVRWLADRLEPGYGTAAAITLGVGTIVMTFAGEYFSHVISASLAFAAFLVLFRERQRPARTWMVAAAGLLAGLAVSFEYQVGLIGAVLLFYALARSAPRPRRALAYAGAALLGALPSLAFNQWAFGSPFELGYSAAVAVPGLTGHAVLGLNSTGFFGISIPKPAAAFDILLAGRGLLTLTPVMAPAIAGVVLMRRGEHRAEANLIAAVAAVYFLYNCGYWLPFGGGSPGPRFQIPALPFIAVGFAFAYRRLPAITLALGIPSALFMVLGSITFPLLNQQGTREWAHRLTEGQLEHTLLTAFGVSNAWLALAPLAAAVATAIVLAVRATPPTRVWDLRPALFAVLAWAAISVVTPTIAADPVTPIHGGEAALALIGAGLLLSLAFLGAVRVRRRSDQPASAEPALALGAERIS